MLRSLVGSEMCIRDSVIINLVIAALLQPDVTPRPIPSALTETLPALLVVWHGAGPMAIAVAGTSLQGAVPTIPSISAQAGAVTTHS